MLWKVEDADLEDSLQVITPEDNFPGEEGIKAAAVQRPWGRQECGSFKNTQEGELVVSDGPAGHM